MASADLAKLVSSAEKACSDATVVSSPEGARAVDALNVLKKTKVTVATLTDTQAGRRIKKLTKHASSTIANAAKAVVEAWRTAVDQVREGLHVKQRRAIRQQEKARTSTSKPDNLHTQASAVSLTSIAQNEAENGLTPQPSMPWLKHFVMMTTMWCRRHCQ